jgi:hypothetical protein
VRRAGTKRGNGVRGMPQRCGTDARVIENRTSLRVGLELTGGRTKCRCQKWARRPRYIEIMLAGGPPATWAAWFVTGPVCKAIAQRRALLRDMLRDLCQRRALAETRAAACMLLSLTAPAASARRPGEPEAAPSTRSRSPPPAALVCRMPHRLSKHSNPCPARGLLQSRSNTRCRRRRRFSSCAPLLVLLGSSVRCDALAVMPAGGIGPAAAPPHACRPLSSSRCSA